MVKILTKTYIGKRLSVPTLKKKCFRNFRGQHKVENKVGDKNGKVWASFCSKRKKKGYPKPVLCKGWLQFLRRWRLATGDKVIFYRKQGNAGEERHRIGVIKRTNHRSQNHDADRTMSTASYSNDEEESTITSTSHVLDQASDSNIEEEPNFTFNSRTQAVNYAQTVSLYNQPVTERVGVKFELISQKPHREPKLIDFLGLGSQERRGNEQPSFPTLYQGLDDSVMTLQTSISVTTEDSDSSIQHVAGPQQRPVRNRKVLHYLLSPYVDYWRILKEGLMEIMSKSYYDFKQTTYRRYVGLPELVNADFFWIIEDISAWLHAEHIDAFLCLLARRIMLGSNVCPSTSRYCILDSYFFTAIGWDWTRANPNLFEDITEPIPLISPAKDLQNYVRGEAPHWGVPWWTVDYVLLVCNLEKHWVSAKIALPGWMIYIYDSLAYQTDAQITERQFDCLKYLLPTLLEEAGYFDEAGISPRREPFGVFRVPAEEVCGQPDSNSCGIYSSYFLDSLVRGEEIRSQVGCLPVEDLRMDMAFQIFLNSLDP